MAHLKLWALLLNKKKIANLAIMMLSPIVSTLLPLRPRRPAFLRFSNIGGKRKKPNEKLSPLILFQRIAIAIQRGNHPANENS